MLVIAKQRDDLWDEFKAMRNERNNWWDKYLLVTAPRREKSGV